MSRRHVYAVLLALGLTGCTATLPPHVVTPVRQVVRVDTVWWTQEQQCQIRLVVEPINGDAPWTIQVPVDVSVCRSVTRGKDVTP